MTTVFDSNRISTTCLPRRIPAAPSLVRAQWSEHIHEELRRKLVDNYPDMAGSEIDKLIQFLERTVPDCLVEGYEGLTEALKLPDPDDRHVAAAAIKAGAQVIVTRDGRGFSPEFLDQYGMCLKDLDDFLADLV